MASEEIPAPLRSLPCGPLHCTAARSQSSQPTLPCPALPCPPRAPLAPPASPWAAPRHSPRRHGTTGTLPPAAQRWGTLPGQTARPRRPPQPPRPPPCTGLLSRSCPSRAAPGTGPWAPGACSAAEQRLGTGNSLQRWASRALGRLASWALHPSPPLHITNPTHSKHPGTHTAPPLTMAGSPQPGAAGAEPAGALPHEQGACSLHMLRTLPACPPTWSSAGHELGMGGGGRRERASMREAGVSMS